MQFSFGKKRSDCPHNGDQIRTVFVQFGLYLVRGVLAGFAEPGIVMTRARMFLISGALSSPLFRPLDGQTDDGSSVEE